jgi:hypothetical protein
MTMCECERDDVDKTELKGIGILEPILVPIVFNKK